MSLIFETQFEKGSFIEKVSCTSYTVDYGNPSVLYKTAKGYGLIKSSVNEYIKWDKNKYDWRGATKLTYVIWLRKDNFIKSKNLPFFSIKSSLPSYSIGNLFQGYSDNYYYLSLNYGESPGGDTGYAGFLTNTIGFHQVVFTFNGSLINANRITGYLNGIKQTMVVNGTITTSINNYSYANHNVLGVFSVAYSKSLNPILKVKVYNHILTQKEINADYQQFLNSKPSQKSIYFNP